jgi:hypothetical protein
VLVAPITAVRLVKLNNAISDWSCLVDENGVFFPLHRIESDHCTDEMLDIFVTICDCRALSRSFMFSGHLMGTIMFVVYDKKLQGRRDVMLANRGVRLTATCTCLIWTISLSSPAFDTCILHVSRRIMF